MLSQIKLTGTTYHRELTVSVSPDKSPPRVMLPSTTLDMTQERNSLCWAATRGINAAERRKEGLRFMMLRLGLFICCVVSCCSGTLIDCVLCACSLLDPGSPRFAIQIFQVKDDGGDEEDF